MELVELLVRMDCEGCERKVRKQLSKLKGVDSVEIDLRLNKVTVLGYVDRRKVLKAVRKTGKRAEFWQEAFTRLHNYSYYDADDAGTHNFRSYYSHNHSYNKTPLSSQYISQHHPFKRTYNYEKHGYNHYNYMTDEAIPFYDHHGSSSQGASSMFSDENPNACSIM